MWAAFLFGILLPFTVPTLNASSANPCHFALIESEHSTVAIERGHYKGRTFDTSRDRSVQSVNQHDAIKFLEQFRSEIPDQFPSLAEVNTKLETGELVAVANVSGINRAKSSHTYFLAVIPVNEVDRVIIQQETFPSSIPLFPAAHVQLRLSFKTPVFLFDHHSRSNSPPARQHNLVISTQALLPEKVGFDIIQGLYPSPWTRFNLVHRLITLERRAFENIDFPARVQPPERHTVFQYEISDLTAAEKSRIIRNFIRAGTQERYGRAYHSFNASCATEAYRFIYEALDFRMRGRKKNPWQKIRCGFHRVFTSPILARFPLVSHHALNLLGVQVRRIPTLNEERERFGFVF